jgi:hypothetical protein
VSAPVEAVLVMVFMVGIILAVVVVDILKYQT